MLILRYLNLKGVIIIHSDKKNKDSLEQLMHRAQQGDSYAYNCLLKRISPIIKNVLKEKISLIRDREDILQEILISVHKASNTYDVSRPFLPWLYSIIRYRINDYLRKYYLYKEKTSIVSIDEEMNHLHDDRNIIDSYHNIQHVQDALNTLNTKQRNIIIMTKINGFTIREVALASGMNESTLKVTAHRAMKNLAAYNQKEKLDEYR